MWYAAVVAAVTAAAGTLAIAHERRAESPAAAVQQAPARQAAQTAATPSAGARQQDFRWSGRLARGREIEIRGIVGDIVAEPAAGDQVEVVGVRRGEDAHRVRIEVVEHADGVVVCAVHPRGRDRGREDRARNRVDQVCNDGDVVENDEDRDDARVNFTVRVPAGVRFAGRTVAGDVRATALRGPVDVTSVSGDVRVSTTGPARATTVSGDVDVAFGETDGSEMEFTSVSGDVTLRLAGGVGARVNANTLSGDIRSDFPLDMGHMADERDEEKDGPVSVRVHVRVGQQARGTIGRGGPELRINTVSGDIRLARAQ